MAEYLQRLRIARPHLRRERVFRDRTNPLEYLDEDEFRHTYRLKRDSVLFLTDLLINDLERVTARSQPLAPALQVCACLRFLATGTFHQVIGDTYLGISRASVCRSVNAVNDAICQRGGNFIQFPRGNEADRVKAAFYRMHGMFV